MEALILSCSTGGGHNAAARAVQEAMTRRGHHAVLMDPYDLVSIRLSRAVGSSYVRMVQFSPALFGVVYRLGDAFRNLPIPSPVYGVNIAMAGKMEAYLRQHHYDVIVCTHVYPAEILTYLRRRGAALPKLLFIATDYTCIPFTEETDCDRYIIPSPELKEDFLYRGIPAEKLVPTGIPVGDVFQEAGTRKAALQALRLNPDYRYLLLSGGSLGGGQLQTAAEILAAYLRDHPAYRLIVICGNNRNLLVQMRKLYGQNPQILLLATTNRMALYMRACDVFLSKPGGLSSTEAAVSGTPLIHVAPIPGCEDRNLKFFAGHHMSIAVGRQLDRLPEALARLLAPGAAEEMRKNQRAFIPQRASDAVCDLAEALIAGDNS